METAQHGQFYSGTSGLVLPVSNKQSYPPEFQDQPRLTYYAALFNSIEINSSFYKVPMAATVKKWAGGVPDNFRFTFKLWRNITHNKGLAFNPADIERFMAVINQAGDKKGSLLVQFPPSVKAEAMPQLANLLNSIRQNNLDHAWDIAAEFRNKSWYQEKTYHLLDSLQMGLVLHDLPASASPLMETDANFIYLRFHGPNGGYRGSYPDDVLSEYAQYIRDWQVDGKKVYAYFNNTMGNAVQNLQQLNSFVRASAHF
ncbi:MAG: DUF72 domain-containing protein [Bacteroidota bacterium]